MAENQIVKTMRGTIYCERDVEDVQVNIGEAVSHEEEKFAIVQGSINLKLMILYEVGRAAVNETFYSSMCHHIV